MAGPDKPLSLRVATPSGMAVKTEVDTVQVPSILGELGVLPQHTPLLAALKPGVLRYRMRGEDVIAAVDSGYVEIGETKVTLLTGAYATPSSIDIERARNELKKAEEQLKEFEGLQEGVAYEEIQRAIRWAQARIEVAGRGLN